jgi:hypothetical protein
VIVTGSRTKHSLVYFAYGSNMLLERLRKRVASARKVGIAYVEGSVLRWHKRGRDRSGKCDIVETRAREDVVWGVLFDIFPGELSGLCKAEAGYELREVAVRAEGGPRTAITYSAPLENTDPTLQPFGWYKALVVAGAQEHGLPGRYVGRLQTVAAIADSDVVRAERMTALLGHRRAGRKSSHT